MTRISSASGRGIRSIATGLDPQDSQLPRSPRCGDLNNVSRLPPDQGRPDGRLKRDLVSLARLVPSVRVGDPVRMLVAGAQILEPNPVAGLHAPRSALACPNTPNASASRRATAGCAYLTRRVSLREIREGDLSGSALVARLVEHIAAAEVIAMGRRPDTVLRVAHDPHRAVVWHLAQWPKPLTRGICGS